MTDKTAVSLLLFFIGAILVGVSILVGLISLVSFLFLHTDTLYMFLVPLLLMGGVLMFVGKKLLD